ncbi:MAG: translation initiation factor IF-2 [Candidatus Melainabacteria bacterium]|jgi:translation initiation factor IF-2|nr:translation initiation factor IF-2 [Candidatus Melainabacteria bacterium]
MATAGKIRIYDLARDCVPESLDDKVQKKVQAELTRRILNLAPEYGQSPKTASSSIDLSASKSIMDRINVEQIIETSSTGTTTKTKSVTRQTPAVEEKKEETKPKLKIVRRITKIEQEEEKAEEEKQDEAPTAAISQTEEAEEEVAVDERSDEEIQSDKKFGEMKENLQGMMQSNKPDFNKPAPIKNIGRVSSIPLRPVSRPRVTDSASAGNSQPYRVAKPTTVSQGMGRKKKRGQSNDKVRTPRPSRVEYVDEGPKEAVITKPMTVRELSQQIGIPETQIITYFFMRSVIKTVNDMLEKTLIVEYLESMDYVVHTEEDDEGHVELESTLKEDETEGNLEKRPPVVTIMGHVDHGKTTLVDTIRKARAKVVDQESGGITQHISTYRIEAEDFDGNTRKITILDTPGHEAFTAMRKRGANVTDIIVLIVAADDGVMPQTIECIKHIKDSKIPFLVAVNKIDKDGANADKVLGQLAEYQIITEEYGGTVECARISALKNEGIDDLLMKVMLVADAELADKIKSNPNRLAIGTVIEAELSRSKGPLATMLVQNGTLRIGDYIAAGGVWGRVKAMIDETGSSVPTAAPSTAVTVLGLSGVPKAGDSCIAYKNIKEARSFAEEQAQEDLDAKRFRGIYNFASEIKEGQVKELRIIIKADVQGSAEAISHEINKLSSEEVLVKPISIASGSITSNDIMLAEQTGAVVVGFHVGVDTASTAKQAEKAKVTIKSYEVIYKLTEDLERAVLGMHEPEYEDLKLGELEVRQMFTKDGRNIAGCMVTNGKIVRNEIARVMRDGAKIYEGKVDYLRRFKDDAKEVKENFECGLSFEKYDDLQIGDIVECWTVKEIARAKL